MCRTSLIRLLWQVTARPPTASAIGDTSHMPWQMTPLRTDGSANARPSSSAAGEIRSTRSA